VHGAAVVVACFALVALLLAWSRWLAGRRLAAAGHVAMAIAAAAGSLLMWSVTAGLESYEPVPQGQPVAGRCLWCAGNRRSSERRGQISAWSGAQPVQQLV